MILSIELSGGLEALFDKRKKLQLAFDGIDKLSIRDLVTHLKDNIITSNAELFSTGDVVVRPGVLVLINDVDWEVGNGADSILHDGDRVTFISTLHGG